MTTSSRGTLRNPDLRIDTRRADDVANQDIHIASPQPLDLRSPRTPVQLQPSTPFLPQTDEFPENKKRTLQESRKLLAHLLRQLHHRPLPPRIYDVLETYVPHLNGQPPGIPIGAMRTSIKSRKGVRDSGAGDDEDEEDENAPFTTDLTYDLMLQLKEILVTSVQYGWQPFHDSSEPFEPFERPGKSSPFRRTRTSLQPAGKRSRSRSPTPTPGTPLRAPELLSQCIAILASVVTEDCRYKISSPRPSRPPYALQALTLDIAQLIIRVQMREPKTISRVCFALIPSFVTFHPAMHIRLLTFFEESIMRNVLLDLKQMRSNADLEPNSIQNEPTQRIDVEQFGYPLLSIQVEEAGDEFGPVSDLTRNWRPWSGANATKLCLQSTNTPYQSLSIYHLASVTAPLLASVLEVIDLENSRPELLHRTFRLLAAIVTAKLDAYLDVLEVIAFHTPKARRAALSLLTTFWPKTLGHVFITTPFCTLLSLDTQQPQDSYYAHEFVPWRFGLASSPSPEVASQYICRSCSLLVRGFGLLCPLCMCAVHFDCYNYPEGCQNSGYVMSSNQAAQAVATYRFCHILSAKTPSLQHVLGRERHRFRLVTLFTLCLCFICRKPLWGCTAQAYRCASCKLFAHPTCVSASTPLELCDTISVNSGYMEVDWSTLRRSFIEHYGDILLEQEYLDDKPYEEVSVLFAALWTQLQIMDNGVAYGSIVVKQPNLSSSPAKNKKINEFELHDLVKLYQKALASERLPVSEALIAYFHESQLKSSDIDFMFDWPTLTFIAANVKSSYPVERPITSTSSPLLDVSLPDMPQDVKDSSFNPFEVTSLSRMRDVLGNEFQLHSDAAARLVLSHLFQLGFFNRIDLEPILFDAKGDHGRILCTSPLPLGLDVSSNVETLVSAIEACLHDLDLSVNEAGFLLLVRRLWPSGMLSDYALRRVAKTVLSWIFAEDDSLVIILRDYVAKQIPVPGLRLGDEAQPWPFLNTSQVSSSGGGEYVNARNALLTRYAARWLLAVHNLDIASYADLLYKVSFEIAIDSVELETAVPDSRPTGVVESQKIKAFDQSLRLIIKLMQTSVVFTAIDDIILRWLDAVSGECYKQPIPSVLRLFSREMTEAMRRPSSSAGTPMTKSDIPSQIALDPWRLVKDHASKGKVGLGQALRWLCLLARSGVDMPVTIFTDFAFLAVRFDISLEDGLLLVTAALSSTWLRSMGRQQLHTLFPALHCLLAPQVVHCMQTKIGVADALCFVRQSLATCLLLCGCERSTLMAFDMVLEEEIDGLPSRRKLNSRGLQTSDPIILDKELLNALERYLSANMDEVTCLVAKFLNLFLTECSLVEPHEADNFIFRSAKMLSACAWSLYDIQRHDISSLRTTFLLRIIAVDHAPFQEILRHWFQTNTNWQLRVVAVTRLFRIILDTPSPEFNVDGKQWRTSLIDVFYHFFTSMWGDAREEIRLAVETWSQSLLAAHFDAISLCWDEALTKTPMEERARLVAFLIQLHPHFPRWRVVSFSSITELLREDDNEYSQMGTQGKITTSGSEDQNLDFDMTKLRVSTVSLALHLIGDGISIDLLSLLKIKVALLRLIGFTDVAVTNRNSGAAFYVTFSTLEVIPEPALPCIHDIPFVLDAAFPFNLPPSAMGGPNVDDETPVPLLVGSAFVDVLLITFCAVPHLDSMAIPTLKSFLEAITIIIYKHDFDNRSLKHLQNVLRKAVRRVMDLMLLNVSSEIVELALSVAQAFVKRWPTYLNALVLDCIECVAKLTISLDHGSQQVLAAEARDFIELALKAFASNGILIALCKVGLPQLVLLTEVNISSSQRQLDREFFLVLKQVTEREARTSKSTDSGSLRGTLLRDALSRAAENELSSFQQVLDNLNTFVEVVHHQDYDPDLMQTVGVCITNVARRTSDWVADAFDPGALLMLTSTVVQYNKAQCRELLGSLETVLRAMLVRFHVTTKALTHLLRVTSTIYQKTQASTETLATQVQPNSIMQAVLETLADGLRMKMRVSPVTLAAILEAVTPTESPGSAGPGAIPVDSVRELAEDALNFLQQYLWSEAHFEKDYNISIVIAKMILESADQNPQVLARQVTDHGYEKYRQHVGVRTWNLLLLATLPSGKDSWGANLFAHFPAFTVTYYNALRSFTHEGVGHPDSSAASINHAYASIKLWLLLAQQLTSRRTRSAFDRPSPETSSSHGSENMLLVWNELWPHFERLVNVFEAEAEAGQLSPLATLAWSSLADLFMFVRTLPSALSLDAPSQMAILARLRRLSRQESANSKLSRALRSMTAPPQADVPFEQLVSQAEKDVIAAEKLDALEAKRRDAVKSSGERSRRDVRLMS